MRKTLFSFLKIILIALVAYLIVTNLPSMDTPPTVLSDRPTNATTTGTFAVFHTSKGNFELELLAGEMPITVGNFTKLAEAGFYNETRFHRVIDGFMIQGGDPLTKDTAEKIRWGTGGPGYTIEDEFVSGLSNVRGTISMANTGQPNSGGSQFFINLVDNIGLDFDKPPASSRHPVFGRVVFGMDVIDLIAGTTVDERDAPLEDVVITRIEILQK